MFPAQPRPNRVPLIQDIWNPFNILWRLFRGWKRLHLVKQSRRWLSQRTPSDHPETCKQKAESGIYFGGTIPGNELRSRRDPELKCRCSFGSLEVVGAGMAPSLFRSRKCLFWAEGCCFCLWLRCVLPCGCFCCLSFPVLNVELPWRFWFPFRAFPSGW